MLNDLSEDESDAWCVGQRQQVLSYLAGEGFQSPTLGDWPAWHVAPIISVWAVESVEQPGWVGWWVVSGDFPTDYIACGSERQPRQALRDIGQRWQDAAQKWAEGKPADGWSLRNPAQEGELAPLLAARAKLFLKIAANDGIWGE